MNRIVFSAVTDPTIQQPITTKSFQFLQNAISEMDVVLAMDGYGPHQSTLAPKFLGNTGRLSGNNFLGGWFFGGAFLPEIYYVEPANNIHLFSNPPLLKPSFGWATSGSTWPHYIIADPVTFTDNIARSVHSIQRYVMVDEPNTGLPGSGLYSNWLFGGTSAVTVASTGSWTGNTYANVNNATGMCTLKNGGTVASILSSGTLGTLPPGFRPTSTRNMPVTVIDDGSYKAGILTIDSAGSMTVSGTFSGVSQRGVFLDGLAFYVG